MPTNAGTNCCVVLMMRAGLSLGEGGNGNNNIELVRDEENFRNGLKRNIAHLSNLARVNQEELARLQEQVSPYSN